MPAAGDGFRDLRSTEPAKLPDLRAGRRRSAYHVCAVDDENPRTPRIVSEVEQSEQTVTRRIESRLFVRFSQCSRRRFFVALDIAGR